MRLFQKKPWLGPCVSNVGSEDENGNTLIGLYRSSSPLALYIFLLPLVLLLNQKNLRNSITKPTF